MTGRVVSPRKTAKSGARQSAGKRPPKGGSISPLMEKFMKRFPHKTAVELALRTGADVKHCEKCLSGTRSLGAEFQAELLRSDFGKDALITLMGDSRAPWWRGFRRHLEISELRRRQSETEKRLAALELAED